MTEPQTAHEIRFHGRGGQGAVLASKILAKALVGCGHQVSAIPAFGFERRGAPVAAFLRYADRPLRAATNIYNPDLVLCIDPTVAQAVDIYAGMRDQGTLVQASSLDPNQINTPPRLARLAMCDAVRIGLELFGKPITNTIMLGAFARASGAVTLEALTEGLKSASFRDAGLEQNIKAMELGYQQTRVYQREGGQWR